MFRNDAAIARVSALICIAGKINNTNTGQPLTARELQPFLCDEDEAEATPEQIAQLIGGKS